MVSVYFNRPLYRSKSPKEQKSRLKKILQQNLKQKSVVNVLVSVSVPISVLSDIAALQHASQ